MASVVGFEVVDKSFDSCKVVMRLNFFDNVPDLFFGLNGKRGRFGGRR